MLGHLGSMQASSLALLWQSSPNRNALALHTARAYALHLVKL